MRRCPNCGEPLQDLDRVCTNCGAFLDVEPNPEEEIETPKKKKKHAKKKDKSEPTENKFFNFDVQEPNNSEEEPDQSWMDLELSTDAYQPSSEGHQRKFPWQLPVMFIILGAIFMLSSIILKIISSDLLDPELPDTLKTVAIGCWIGTVPALIIAIILYVLNKGAPKVMTSLEILNSNATPAEQRRMAYVGQNYVKMSKQEFSFAAFLGSFYYLLYRKKYVVGILGLWLIILLLFFAKTSVVILVLGVVVLVIINLLLGLKFNGWYIKTATKKTKKLRERTDDLTSEEFIKLCQKKGGTSYLAATVIFSIFLVISVSILTSNFKFHPTAATGEVTDTAYSEKRNTCSNYFHSVEETYQSYDREVTYFGCYLGDSDPYILLEAIDNNTQLSYIAKYEINEQRGQLLLDRTTEQLKTLREKKENNTLTEEEKVELTEEEDLEEEFSEFKEFIKEEKKMYKQDSTYERNYVNVQVEKFQAPTLRNNP